MNPLYTPIAEFRDSPDNDEKPTWDQVHDDLGIQPLGTPNRNLDKFLEAMFQTVSPLAAVAAAPSQFAALQQIQALMAIQMQHNSLFPTAEDTSKTPSPEMASSPAAKRMRLSPNTSDESVASTSKDGAEPTSKSPKSCEFLSENLEELE